jgi:hypothetical protein
MMCPFFQAVCLKGDCTAYSIREEIDLRNPHRDAEAVDAIFYDITMKPYCSALNSYLPQDKKETE